MTEEQNKAILQRYIDEVWNKKNLAAIDEFFAPDYIAHTPFGELRGPEGHRQSVSEFIAIPDYHVTIDDVIAEADKVVVRRTDRFTHQVEFMGYPPTGKQVTTTSIAIYRIENDKIMEAWGEEDMKRLLEQLGATLVPKAA